MAYNRAQAQKLCNDSELQLVVASMADEVVKLTAAQLRSKITRARTLRDKNTDLFRRQTTATRSATNSKRGNTGVANQRTEQKARLFDETLKRLEVRLAKVEAAAAKAIAKPIVKGAVARKSPTKAAVAKAPAQPAAPKKSVARKAGAKQVASAGKPAPAARKMVTKAAASKAAAGTTAARKAVAKPVAKAPVARSQRPATAVSKVVSVRGKNIGAHARSANAKGQAKRAGR